MTVVDCTAHSPYAVEATTDGRVYVSAWGGQTVSIFRVLDDGKLAYSGRLRVGPRPSALASNAAGSRLFVALAGSDQIAVVDTRARKILRYLRDQLNGTLHLCAARLAPATLAQYSRRVAEA